MDGKNTHEKLNRIMQQDPAKIVNNKNAAVHIIYQTNESTANAKRGFDDLP